MENDRLSILRRVEKGEISIEEAKEILGQASHRDIPSTDKIEPKEKPTEEKESGEIDSLQKAYAPTRRERKLALAEKFKNLGPDTMMSLEEDISTCQWPWPDRDWTWMWQNLEYPVYINHSMELSRATQLKILTYHGDMYIHGWDQPTLLIKGAVFDLRIGQDANIVSIASSTGQVQVWVPNSVTDIDARVSPGDMWISKVTANAILNCSSGDLGCDNIKGDIKALINGGDVRIMDTEGAIYIDSMRGNTNIKNIQSSDVTIKADEGDISLNLNSITGGRFRCENDKGDINLITGGEMSCELLVEASEDGKIAPVIMPWKRLLERSQHKLHGILKDGGASINLITQSGTIYIQESWMSIESSRVSN